ncbi:MAG: GNAT family N-acetyltransferase [Fusobacteriota bacterium]
MKRLETNRLILRNWELSDSDINDLFEYAKSDLVGPRAGWKPHENKMESQKIIKRFIDDGNVYALELKSNKKVIGSIGIHERYPDKNLKHLDQRELGFVLNPEFWGKGIIPEAVNVIIDYCFNSINLDIIWCGHFQSNYNSKRVNQKCGFKYRFKRKEKIDLLDNKPVMIYYYNIFKENYNLKSFR